MAYSGMEMMEMMMMKKKKKTTVRSVPDGSDRNSILVSFKL